jgi:threonine/homoserine/homoserine lactone efflux protein
MILPVDPKLYAAFLGVMIVLALTPGPAVLYAVATGARSGKRAALAGGGGHEHGHAGLVHGRGSGPGRGGGGLSRRVPLADGGGRLLCGLAGPPVARQAPRHGPDARSPDGAPAPAPASAHKARPFGGGFAVQIANPKVLLFFTAILPPFLDPDRPLAPQLVLFALGTIGLDVFFMSAYGLGGRRCRSG